MSITQVPVTLAVGTHTWAPTLASEKEIEEIVRLMRKHKVTRLDTHRSYGNGASETVIGNKTIAAEFVVGTKADYNATLAGRGLTAEKLLESASASLKALKVERVPIYLLHVPDDRIPVSETMKAIQHLYEEGHFEKLGVSNFTLDQVLAIHTYAKEHNMVLPTIYQASYSPVVRLNESLLFPTLRDLGISIQAYSPMAGGFLSKTPAQITAGTSRRWDLNAPSGTVSRNLFFKPSYMAMLEKYGKLAEESGVGRLGGWH